MAPLMFGVVGVVCEFSFGGSDSAGSGAGFGASVGTTLSDGAGVAGFGADVVEAVFAGAGAAFFAVATACGARTATETPVTAYSVRCQRAAPDGAPEKAPAANCTAEFHAAAGWTPPSGDGAVEEYVMPTLRRAAATSAPFNGFTDATAT